MNQSCSSQIGKTMKFEPEINMNYRGGSRTCRRRGRQPLEGRRPYIFIHFLIKPNEIKEILGRWGGDARRERPPKSATAIS